LPAHTANRFNGCSSGVSQNLGCSVLTKPPLASAHANAAICLGAVYVPDTKIGDCRSDVSRSNAFASADHDIIRERSGDRPWESKRMDIHGSSEFFRFGYLGVYARDFTVYVLRTDIVQNGQSSASAG
jgi:hypothetical protein